MRVENLEAIRIKVASPEEILNWSHGEVTKPETINYRTQRAEKDGLFCERIFGPEKDYQCYCGKYKKIRYKGVICDRCGVEVTTSHVRRERMGHIKLACPVSHIWFLRGVPSRAGLVLNIPVQQLERVVYFVSYIITKVAEEEKKKILEEIEREFKEKVKGLKVKESAASIVKGQKSLEKDQKSKTKDQTGRQDQQPKTKLNELKKAMDRAKEEVMGLKPFRVLSEIEYQKFSLKYGQAFEAETGAEALRKIFENLDLKKEIKKLRKEVETAKEAAKRKNLIRLRLFEGMAETGIRPEWMFLTIIPVMPPDLRPMVQLDGGRFASSDLNDLYRRVINRNNRLKYLLEVAAPEVIVRNEKRMLQEAVDALIDNGMRKGTTIRATTGGRRLLKSVADMLKGKQGRFRQNLLGKRVDYSGRSVIVGGPELKLYQVGLPNKMALELFKPFVLRKVLEKELAYNLRSATRLVDEQEDEIWAILEEIVKDKLVLLNRAPTLHRLGVQAFEPILIEGEAIRIHPLVCRAFNADFDGDQMAVYIPLSAKAQKEARERMLSSLNLLKPATGNPVITPSQDIVMGCFWLTRIKKEAKGEGKMFNSFEEAVLAYEMGIVDLRAGIRVRMPLATVDKKSITADNNQRKSAKNQRESAFLETTVGRILFNEVLPEDYPFQNEPQRIKELEKLISAFINDYPAKVVVEILDKMKNLGFESATLAGISWGVDDLIIPGEKPKIMEFAQEEIKGVESQYGQGFLSREERKSLIVGIWHKAKMEIERVVPKALPEHGPVFTMVESGSRGSWLQVVQMSGMKGLVTNPLGQTIELPVKNSYKEGFSVLEYFISTHGARKGTTDTALRTSTAGYLTRRLVDVAHEIVISEPDCKDKEGIVILREEADEISQNFVQKIVGRVALEDIKTPLRVIVKKGEIIDWQKAREITDAGVKRIRVYSPLSCKVKRGLCQKCYGWDLGRNKLVALGEAVGIVAAQAIGEPGTQLTMRTFHTGGVASSGDITSGLPRVEEIFEVRIPASKAQISKTRGKVLGVTSDRVVRIKVSETSQSLSADSKKKGKPKKKAVKEKVLKYQIPNNQTILVDKGQEVQKGQPLSEGNLDIRELFKLMGVVDVQRYIIQEVQKIYVSQGVTIHDKHIEVIVRQLFSRVKIKEAGDSSFISGKVVGITDFLEEQEGLKEKGKALAKAEQLLLGITRVALTTSSFLSAASFQETSRVLIEAALVGKEDKLRGLKENVIIGKLIPAGTGLRKA